MTRSLAPRLVVCIASLVVLHAGSLDAARLAVMGSQTHFDQASIPVGDRLYTIGVIVDVDGIDGPGPFILRANLGFQGAAGNPIQTTAHQGSLNINVTDRQGIQDLNDLGVLSNSMIANAVYADSWWYASGTGQLSSQGPDDSIPPTVVTTDPLLGPTGALWQPEGTGEQGGGSSGSDMHFQGVYGGGTPVGAGLYPLVQILTSANVNVLFDADTKISLQPVAGGPTQNFNVFGSAVTADDPQAFLSFNPLGNQTNPNALFGLPIPEPATLALFATGLPAICWSARARRKS